MKVYALIPARGGSKGVPGKNIKLLKGYPLIAYSIAAARLSQRTDRIVVSTDSKEIAEIALRYGAEVPFLRPAELAGDKSTDLDWMRQAFDWLEKNGGGIPDLALHLRPTTPLRDPAELDKAVAVLKDRPGAGSLRSAHELPEPPQKMLQIDPEGFFQGFFPDDPRPEYYNLPRQMFPPAYHPNGYVDIVRPARVKATGTLYGDRMVAFISPVVQEVDTPEDFEYIEYQLRRKGSPLYDYLVKNFPEGER